MKNDQNARLNCPLCEFPFPTLKDKEDHLRLHCIICNLLFESKDILQNHMTKFHSDEAASGLFWEIRPSTNSEDDDLSPDERDRAEYVREHPE